jgi:hypothetical protein
MAVHSFSYSWYNLQLPFLAIHLADEHRMMYSFSNTTSYSTFYAFFSSIRITLWPMWLAKSKRPCFMHHSHTHKKTRRTDKKLTYLMGNLCCVREHSVQVFVQFFFTCICLSSGVYSVWPCSPYRVCDVTQWTKRKLSAVFLQPIQDRGLYRTDEWFYKEPCFP